MLEFLINIRQLLSGRKSVLNEREKKVNNYRETIGDYLSHILVNIAHTFTIGSATPPLSHTQ